jgi:hypothetical protein
LPSRTQKGSILNNANQMLIMNPNLKVVETKSDTGNNIPNRQNNAMATLVKGPAIEMIPFCFLEGLPMIKTAPGAANITPAKLIKTAKNSMP